MFRIKSATRLAVTIGFICLTLVCLAMSLNLIPNPQQLEMERRLSITRGIAVAVSTLAESNCLPEMQLVLERNAGVEPCILSIGVRRERGRKNLVEVGPHNQSWNSVDVRQQDLQQIAIDILSNGRKWGQLEIVFHPEQRSWLGWLLQFPNGLIGFMSSSLTLLTWLVLNKTFRYLNPSKVVPDRVRNALDSIGSGLVLLSPSGEIAHANKAFGKIVRQEISDILGGRIDSYQWSPVEEGQQELPWQSCQKTSKSISGEIIESRFAPGQTQKFMVNASPILGSKNQTRGLIISFQDVTALENKKSELAKIIQTVRSSRDEVERQNEKLSFLASFDPLTKCMNRRSFYSRFQILWAETTEHPLTIMMLDIDHFKRVNDDHGHSTGDTVLAKVGEILISTVGKLGTVCRYGGEEFTVLLPNLPFESSCELAEKIRAKIQAEPIAGLAITTSLGLANRAMGAMDSQHMLDQADQCLYAAKRNGRNQVVRFDVCPVVFQEVGPPNHNGAPIPVAVVDEVDSVETHAELMIPASNKQNEIEFSSVTGLLSALSFRSPETAAHSVRVADLAVTIGQSMLNHREIFQLEIAALLHDVGKIGVPDSILNKPTMLTEREKEIMRRHDEIGVAIVRSAGASQVIANTIERHQDCKLREKTSEHCNALDSVSARILHVCDAFDSMVSEQVYRKSRTTKQALTEILLNTPQQFDPDVVKQLFDFVASGQYQSQQSCRSKSEDPKSSGRSFDDGQSLSDVEKQPGRGGNCVAVGQPNDGQFAKNPEIERLIELADEVINLCQTTRSTFVDCEEDSESFAMAGELHGSLS